MSLYDDSLSDEEWDLEEEKDIAMVLILHKNKRSKHGGSIWGYETLRRLRRDADDNLMRNYFGPTPIFLERYFRRRFRMSKDLLQHNANSMKQHGRYFEQRRSCDGLLGHSTIQKVTAALRMMAYGIPVDLIDDHLAMGDSTSIECVKRFAVDVVEVFGPEYLRAPNAQHTARLLVSNNAHEFPCMLGSIDCMHWSWKNCPATWHRRFKGHKEDATIILEAVDDQQTWIWHTFVLVCLDLAMTSTCSKDHLYLQCWPMVKHHQWSLKSMAAPITTATTLPMGSFPSGQPL